MLKFGYLAAALFFVITGVMCWKSNDGAGITLSVFAASAMAAMAWQCHK